ncbi:hypothetical protein ATY77_30150 [Rhizobium sp. R634]|nr:hypothetical protein ATY77_30150 [Rhizobium sp. R634]
MSEDRRKIFDAEVIDLLDKDCAAAWKKVWRDARRGDQQALAAAASMVLFRQLIPPSSVPLKEPRSILRHLVINLMTLYLYSWKDSFIEETFRSGFSWDEFEAPTEGLTLFDNKKDRDNFRNVSHCLKTRKDKDFCAALAVELKVIPSFKTYVTMIDKAPHAAFCLSTNAPRRSKEAHSIPLGPGLY